jgi:tetratricopeptide (TPR) repeat protein
LVKKSLSNQVQAFLAAPLLFSFLLESVCFCFCSQPTPQRKSPSDQAYQEQIIEKIGSLLESRYVFPDRAKKCAEEFRLKGRSESYASLENAAEFAEKMTSDLQEITADKHFLVRLIEASDMGEKTESSLHHPVRLFRLRNQEHFGFARLDWLDGNIGYVDIRRFYSPAEAKDMVVAVMRLLSTADAIIIDLRKNQGGAGELLPFLCAYFFEHPTQLSSWYSRELDFLQEFWTAREVEGELLTDVPLFLLTSQKTFSAAESLAYDLKVRKRATIVGEPTKGGAHSVDLYKIDDQFEVYIPTARAVNPVTGGNWEGTGVIPDVPVPAASALDKAAALAKAAGEEFRKEKEKKLKASIDEMQDHLNRAEKLFQEGQEGSGEAALNAVFQSGEKFGLKNEFFISVLAYSYSSAEDEKILYAILRKNIEFFPQSPTAYEALAFAYLTHGKSELALANFRKALELDPDNRNAAKMIKRLSGG